MHSRPSRPAREGGLRRFLVITASLAAALAPAGAALAQGAPRPAKPPTLAPPPKAPDMELDLDAPKPPEKKEEPPAPLPPPEAGAWGVGGKDEEGHYAPGADKKKVISDDDDKGPKVLGSPGAAAVDMVIGFGGMHDVTKGGEITKFTVVSLLFGAQYRLGDSLTIGARFPYSTGKIAGPTKGSGGFSTFAVGNLEVSGRYAIELTHRLTLPIDLAIYFPTASGDLFAATDDPGNVAQFLVNQAAAYSRGFEENPLFASKRMGIRIGAGVAYDKNQIHAEGHTRLDIMGKTGGNLPTAAGLHTPNTTWLTGASFAYDFFGGKLTPALRAWLAVTTLPVFAGTRDDSGAQFVLEPNVSGRFPLNASGALALRGGLGYVLPIAGALGGGQGGAAERTSTGGLRVHAELQF